MCPNFCPCCKSNKQWIRHWLIDCPFFNHIHSKVNDKILFLYNAFNRGNDIVNSNNDNSNSNNSDSNNSISNNSNSNNSYIILVIVLLVMLVIVLKIMCMLILVCVKECLISFLEEEVLKTVQGNGRISLSARWNQVLILILHSWWLLRLFFNRLYLLLLASNGFYSIGSNRIVLLLPRASMLKKQ